MYFIEAIKNLHSYLFQGRCRRHGRKLTEVRATGHYASTMPVCLECYPQYRNQALAEPPQTFVPTLTSVPDFTQVQDFTEVEVG